jgi:hypothetical protein
MKPTRKISPRSFVTQVAGSGGPTGEAQAGQGRGGAPGTDHDLVQPAGKGGGGGAANDADGGH